MLHSIKLLGTTITSESEEKILEYVIETLHKGEEKLFITTPNPEILVYASTHPDYQDKLNSAGVALPDGVGLQWGGRILGRPLQSRVAGTDFIEKLCRACREKPLSIGFLGGRGGVAELTAERLKKKYPWITVAWVGEEWGSKENDAFRYGFQDSENLAQGPASGHIRPNIKRHSGEERSSDSRISHVAAASDSGQARMTDVKEIDILFVAYGFPKQEEWIYENLPKLPVKAAMGVGGAFDYLSGKVVRAPKLVRAIGLEWLFRLIAQPWRLKRQLALIQFVYLVLKEKFV